MKPYWITVVFCAGLLVFSGCKKTPANVSPPQNPSQVSPARPLRIAGCDNLYKVSDVLYRGAQPTAKGFRGLEKRGIRTVVNLRSFHSDRDELKGTALDYVYIPMQAWDPEQEQIEAFLKIVADPQRQPVFVHCQHGADRTGAMTAVYRIVLEGWEIEKAVNEMKNGPFGFHEIWVGLPTFIEELDVEKLRKEFSAVSPVKAKPAGPVQ
ncbi:MAG: tyrosine-protein phosphatase [Planctomycetales bacterium]|nr:tyrosine-protein phosphatase [Planctomycetales bacterium]